MNARRSAVLRVRAGFTLVEMLAVLAIVALLSGLSIQLVRPPAPHLRVEAAARGLCAAARATRARAIATNEETTLTLDLTRKTYFSTVVGETSLPREAHIRISVANGRDFADGDRAAIVFFPGGGSTGGEITLEIAGNHASVDVSWLTGETRCAVS
jgi:general secretion pathway protein H